MLDADNLNFPVAYGPKVSAIRRGVCGCDVEVSYFQIDGFTAGGFCRARGEWPTGSARTCWSTTAWPATRRPSITVN